MAQTLAQRQRHARNNSRTWRERAKAKGFCTYCGQEKAFVQVRNGFTRYYAKCKRCLRRAAWYQAEYRERHGTNRQKLLRRAS